MAGVVVPYTRRRGGKYYLNLRVPADVRTHFPTATGGHRTHIVEALGTGDALAARRMAIERRAHWALHFAALRRLTASSLGWARSGALPRVGWPWPLRRWWSEKSCGVLEARACGRDEDCALHELPSVRRCTERGAAATAGDRRRGVM